MRLTIRIACGLLLLGATLTAQGSAARGGAGRTTGALHAVARSHGDGSHGRPVRGLLPVRLRRLDEEQPDPAGSIELVAPTARCRTRTARCCGRCSSSTRPGTPGRTPNQQKIGDYYGACMAEPEIDRRGAHGDGAADGRHREDRLDRRSRRGRRRQPSHHGRARSHAVQPARRTGREGLHRNHCRHRSERSRPARSRLLPERR